MKCLLLLAVVAVASAATFTPFPGGCQVTCDSTSSAPCAFSNGTTIVVGTTQKVAVGSNITCLSGGFGTTYVYQICANAQAIDQVCVSAALVSLTSFTTESAALNYLNTQGIPYSNPGPDCNAVCNSTNGSSQCAGQSSFACSNCFAGGGCIVTREEDEAREERQGNGIVLVACSTGTTLAQQTACFQAAACAGLINPSNPGVTCRFNTAGVLVATSCPYCPSRSKKGLLGLLGLLGLIPLLLYLSLCCLLLLCCIRRKKTAAAVPFATFDPGLPPVAATYPPLAPTCPVVY